MKSNWLTLSASILALAVTGTASAAQAQDPAAPKVTVGAPADPADEPAAEDPTEIVVTGTQIRGIAPVGANVVGVSEAQIKATGATTTADVLATLPQATNFFNASPFAGGGVIGGNARNAIIRVNLRNLPGSGTTTGSQTLVLVDGHRVVGTGVGVLAIDAEILPPNSLQRIDAMTDGVSALYGSDAIGGVLNFITKKNIDGIEASASYGVADDYYQWSANISAGKRWNGGSIFAAYSYAFHDGLLGRDRDFAKLIDWSTGIPTGRHCNASTITRSGFPTGTSFAGTAPFTPVSLPNAAVSCDDTDFASIYPRTKRHNVFFGLDQELTDTLSIDIRGFFQAREDVVNFGGLKPSTGNTPVTIPNTNYYRNLLGFSSAETQTATFNYGSVLGNDFQTAITNTHTWQITPTISWDVGGDWQIRLLTSYGESRATYANRQINTTLQSAALAGSTAATAINPYDIGATQNLQLIRDIASFVDRGEGENRMTNVRMIADGTLITIPGGAVKLAAGAEYLRNNYRTRSTNQVTRVLNPWGGFAQEVKSLFGELAIPIFSSENATPGFQALNLSLSGRYDKYNDFGDTFNPRVGLTWKPLDWVTLRGSWGKSFNAPTPPDTIGATLGPRIRVIGAQVPAGVTVPAAPIGGSNATIILDQGAIQGLQPQTAKTWSVGFTIEPPVVPGLSLSLSHYTIDLDGQINSPVTGSVQSLYDQLPQFLDIAVTPADIAAAFATNPTTGPALAQQILTNNQQIVTIIDARLRNLGQVHIRGLDFTVNYAHETGFGSVDASFSGNLLLEQKRTIGAVTSDLLANGNPTLRYVATVGANIGNLRAQASLNHSGGYTLLPSATLFNQTSVKAFNLVNLYFRYDFEERLLGKGTSLAVNINNLFDTDPPVLQDRDVTTSGFTNGFTVGRLFQVTLSQKF